MLGNTSLSITYKWSYSEAGEGHVWTFFELFMDEDTMIRTEGTNPWWRFLGSIPVKQ